MSKVIYQDALRTITSNGKSIEVTNARGARSFSLAMQISDNLPADQIAGIRKMGQDPQGWYALCVPKSGQYGGAILGVFPPQTRQAISAEMQAYQGAIIAVQNSPSATERRKVDQLYADAERCRDYPGDYYAALQRAEDALEEWRAKFPAAALRETISELRGNVSEQDGFASDALVYDADGILNREAQEQRAAAFRAKADDYRKQIATLQTQLEAVEADV